MNLSNKPNLTENLELKIKNLYFKLQILFKDLK
jgi:hypothetical protein